MIRKRKIDTYILIISILFLVVFPKGGIKISDIPLTWGYILLGIFICFACLKFLITPNVKIANIFLLIYFSSLPFQICSFLKITTEGYEYIGGLVSFIINFYIFPFAFFIFFSSYFKRINPDYISKILSRAVFFVSIFGIFLFIYKQLIGSYFRIPYITANGADTIEILAEKHNDREGVFKLISTYNNGNIFGVAVLMLFPIFYNTETSSWKKIIVILALFLTLSRTVWLGLLFFFIIEYRHRIFTLLSLGLSIVFSVFLLWGMFFGFSTFNNFIFDLSFGGRIGQFETLKHFSLFGEKKFKFITEVVYMSIYNQFGFIGILCFMIFLLFPFFYYLFFLHKNLFRNSFFIGGIVYLFCCLSDGAMLYIPVMVFFYFCICMMFVEFSYNKYNLIEKHTGMKDI